MPSRPFDYSYVAYIDEAGDPGLNKVAPRTPGGSSEWIIVAAALIPAELEGEVGEWVAEMMKAMNSRQLRDLHFLKLNDTRQVTGVLNARAKSTSGFSPSSPISRTWRAGIIPEPRRCRPTTGSTAG